MGPNFTSFLSSQVQPCAYMPQADHCAALWRTAAAIVDAAIAAASKQGQPEAALLAHDVDPLALLLACPRPPPPLLPRRAAA